MMDFHETIAGQRFFNVYVPRLVDGIKTLASRLAAPTRLELASRVLPAIIAANGAAAGAKARDEQLATALGYADRLIELTADPATADHKP